MRQHCVDFIKEETRRVLRESAHKKELKELFNDGIEEVEAAPRGDPDEAKHDASAAINNLLEDLKDALHEWVADEMGEKHGR